MHRARWSAVLIAGLLSTVCYGQSEVPKKLMPSSMPKTATVDPRFLSYNVEMVEVIGGRFWAPYKNAGTAEAPKPPDPNQPAGIDPNLFQQRTPIDLQNAKQRCAGAGSATGRISRGADAGAMEGRH